MTSSSTSPPPVASKAAKVTLLSLDVSPLAPIYHLPPDPLFPTPDSVFQLAAYEPPEDLAENGPVALKIGDPVPPSMVRRSRQIRMGGTFTYTTPLPLQFPYDLDEPGTEPTGPRKASDIEKQLRKYEVDPSKPVHDAAEDPSTSSSRPTAYTCDKRESSIFPRANLLSVSQKLLDEWLPNLDIGKETGTAREQKVRQQFIDVVAGRTVLARRGEEGGEDSANGVTGFAPWSQAYAGHQFGSFAGQLGDGRAISIACTTPTPQVAASTGFRAIELQLKGAGRTPYSRFADGLAVLRSSVREYLGAEALAALRVPTSRALALVHLPKLHVLRERIENAAIVTRVSGSWLRIGSFELPAHRQEWETLRRLSSYTGRHVFGFEDAKAGEGKSRSMARSVVQEVSKRTAVMIAGWQAYGFCHGVMNSDNFALNGATIDFGPYAFMDVFDPGHICNHSDDMGRYAFNKQPTMGVFAIEKLGDALAPLIGKELEIAQEAEVSGYVEAQHGWTGDEDSEEVNLEEWSKVGKEQVAQIKEEFVTHFKTEYARLMRLKFGLTTAEDGDFQLFSTMLDLMERNELDFTNSFRLLSQFTSVQSPLFSSFLDALLSGFPARSLDSVSSRDRSDWTEFFKKYESRLGNEGSTAATSRRARMDSYNPRFALRQWVLEETIQKLGTDGEQVGVEQLNRVLKMAQNPYEGYGEREIGEEPGDGSGACLTPEAEERRRLAGVGSKDMLGFQCSCSS